jgi:hypothetical protein
MNSQKLSPWRVYQKPRFQPSPAMLKTRAQCLEMCGLILCRNLQISDFSEMRWKVTLSSGPTDGCTASLIGSDIFQRLILILTLDVDESRVSLVESAATRVLAGQANCDSGFYQTREGESFRPCRSPRAAGMGTVKRQDPAQGSPDRRQQAHAR